MTGNTCLSKKYRKELIIMKIDKQILLKGIEIVMPGVDKGNTNTIGADTILFKDGFIYSFNDRLSIMSPSPFIGEIEFSVKAIDFYNLLKKLPDSMLECSIKDKIVIKVGKSTATLSFIDEKMGIGNKIIDYADVEWIELSDSFYNGLVSCFLPNNNCDYSGVYIIKNNIISLDTCRATQYIIDDTFDNSVYIGQSECKELLKILKGKKLFYHNDEKWISFLFNDTIISCKKCLGTYPSEKILSHLKKYREMPSELTGIFPDTILSGIERASVFSMDFGFSINAVRISIKPGKIILYAKRSTGDYKEVIEFESDKIFDPITFYTTYEHMSNLISKQSNFSIKQYEDSPKKIMLESEKYQILLSTFKEENEDLSCTK